MGKQDKQRIGFLLSPFDDYFKHKNVSAKKLKILTLKP